MENLIKSVMVMVLIGLVGFYLITSTDEYAQAEKNHKNSLSASSYSEIDSARIGEKGEGFENLGGQRLLLLHIGEYVAQDVSTVQRNTQLKCLASTTMGCISKYTAGIAHDARMVGRQKQKNVEPRASRHTIPNDLPEGIDASPSPSPTPTPTHEPAEFTEDAEIFSTCAEPDLPYNDEVENEDEDGCDFCPHYHQGGLYRYIYSNVLRESATGRIVGRIEAGKYYCVHDKLLVFE